MKNKIFIQKLILILSCALFFVPIFAFSNVYASTSDIPTVVLEKAKELNHGYDNFVILQDKTTQEYYIPYETSVYSEDNYLNKTWRYTTHNGVYCIVTPSWWLTGLQVYRNDTFVSATTNNVGSNSIIQMSMNDRELEIVYSSKDVIYYNIEGVDNGTVFFPLPVTETTAVTIPALETAEQIPTAIVETLKIVIPVGLVVLGIGLTIYLIKRVIYSSQ